MIEQKTFWVCDPERAVSCSKTGCRCFNFCHTTTDIDEAMLIGGEPLADISFMSEVLNEFDEHPNLKTMYNAHSELFAVRR